MPEGNVEFQTVKAEETKFGKNNFLEIARKKAITEDGENEFIAISRGFFLPDGTKRFKKSIAIPDDSAIVDFLAKKLKEYSKAKSVPAAKKAVVKEEEKEKEETEAEEEVELEE